MGFLIGHKLHHCIHYSAHQRLNVPVTMVSLRLSSVFSESTGDNILIIITTVTSLEFFYMF